MDCLSKIIEGIRSIKVEDDGIKLNQKCKFIQGVLQKECTSAKHLRDMFIKLNENAVKDNEFATNFALLGSTRLFHGTELFGLTLPRLISDMMKDNYHKIDEMSQEDNIEDFYNSLTLFSEYYNRARTSDGGTFDSLAKPFIEYLKVLLMLNTERAAEEFASQLLKNGPKIKKSHPHDLDLLLILVRKQLLADDVKSSIVKYWLLLCIDYSFKKFESMEAKLEKFYVEYLEPKNEKSEVIVNVEDNTVVQEDDVKIECKEPLILDDDKIPTREELKQKILSSINKTLQNEASVSERVYEPIPERNNSYNKFNNSNNKRWNNYNNNKQGRFKIDTEKYDYKPKSGGIQSPRERIRAHLAQANINNKRNDNVDNFNDRKDYYKDKNNVTPKFINYINKKN